MLRRCKTDFHSTDTIILSFFIKSNLEENFAIYNFVKDNYMESCGYAPKTSNLNGIGSSAWWLVFVRLYQYVSSQQKIYSAKGKSNPQKFKTLARKVNVLFGSKQNPNYSELGIFIDLLRD